MTSVINKYRIYCTTDNVWRYIWDNVPPTTCPDDVGHGVNSNSVEIIQIEIEKNITFTDSPYFIRQEFLSCDTTSGIIRVNLPEASKSEAVICYIRRVVGGNNVEIYNNLGVTPILTINISDVVNKLQSNGSVWSTISINDEDNLENNLPLLQANMITKSLIPKSHNKGDLLVADDRSQTILPIGTDDQILVVDSTTPLGLMWKDNTGGFSFSIEGATGATGVAQSGPVTVENNDTMRLWSDNFTIDVVDGPTGPNIQIDPNSDIGYGMGLGEFIYKWQQGQGANWRPYVEFTAVATNPIPQSGGVFWYRGTDELGSIPTQGYIIHNGLYKGSDSNYDVTVTLFNLTDVTTVTTINWSADPGGNNTNFAIPQKYDFLLGAANFPTTPSLLELQVQVNSGDYGRLYIFALF